MNRFQQLFAKQDRVFIPFFMLGDPDIATCFRFVKQAIDAGAHALEIGIPFSDPIADGPVIQASAERALAAGCDIEQCCQLLAKIREYSDIPIGILTYYNPLYVHGETLYRRFNEVGVDAVLAVDCPLEEATVHEAYLKKYNLGCVYLIAANTSEERAAELLSHCTAYAYVVSRHGTTGARDQLPLDLQQRLQQLKVLSAVPLVVGFGISNAQQVAATLQAGADGVIIGSAITKIIAAGIEKHHDVSDAIKNMIIECIEETRIC